MAKCAICGNEGSPATWHCLAQDSSKLGWFAKDSGWVCTACWKKAGYKGLGTQDMSHGISSIRKQIEEYEAVQNAKYEAAMKVVTDLKEKAENEVNEKVKFARIICPNCGEAIGINAKMCRFCGIKFTEEEISERIEKERERVSESCYNQVYGETSKEMEKRAMGRACPVCHSTNLSFSSKDFSVGKAALGTAIAGPVVGLLAGQVGANHTIAICNECGHRFTL